MKLKLVFHKTYKGIINKNDYFWKIRKNLRSATVEQYNELKYS